MEKFNFRLTFVQIIGWFEIRGVADQKAQKRKNIEPDEKSLNGVI
jgi:hypothetical protein